jgi:phenylalanyl-tRNA synthetase beta chain
MKISYNWLKEFVDLKVTPQRLADDLSLFGHEVESIKSIGDDFILDFEITPNRGDCLSIFGMAREVAALYGLNIKHNIGILPKEIDLGKNIKVNIKDNKICSRYSYAIIDNIEIKDSPKWLKEKLEIMGFRSINNIVDITNYVMLELGQPMHAYDYNKIKGGICNIRVSKSGESIITLDGKTRELDDAIVIDDGNKIFDLAGIMGGANSEVDKSA